MRLIYLYLAACGLVLAGIIHIAVILLIPDFGSRDAWNIISRQSDLWSFQQFEKNGKSRINLEDTDPYMKLGACTFDLSDAGLKFTGLKSQSFWSASVFDQDGAVIYSLNNRTAIDNQLNLMVLNPVQMVKLRETPPPDAEKFVMVVADITKGFVVLRRFLADETGRNELDAFMNGAKCKRVSVDEKSS